MAVSKRYYLGGDRPQRFRAVRSTASPSLISHPHMIVNRIARSFRMNARSAFRGEFHQVIRQITVSHPMVVEKRPGPGDQVRVREGVFRDVEGTVLERVNELRLIVAVRLVQQGVTLEIDEHSLDVIG